MTLLNNYEYKIPKIWFHEIKGVQDVATLKELEIANKLTKQRAKIFLESRAYIRKSLGSLFNINPLEIPIIANPGEPPELPKGMGYISFSHCKDAIILVWHEKKIGIDIERQDRDFNYEKLAKKYFFNSNKFNDRSKLNKNSMNEKLLKSAERKEQLMLTALTIPALISVTLIIVIPVGWLFSLSFLGKKYKKVLSLCKKLN